MAGLTNKQKKSWAKTLIISEGKSQKEAAKIVDVSTVTMNKWYKVEEWDRLKKAMLITRETQLSRLYTQLDELTSSIEKRDEGERYANSKDADVISKLTGAIKKMESEAAIDEIVNVGKRFLGYIRRYAPNDAIKIADMFDDFIKDQLKR